MKKVISLALTVVLLFCSAIPAFAGEACSCGTNPIIYIGGLGCEDIIRDRGTANEQKLWKLDTEFAVKQCAPVVLSAAELIATGNYDAFADDVLVALNKVLGDLALDGDGNSKSNVTCEINEFTTTEHGPDRDYYFSYDFRIDPIYIAGQLDKAIDTVLELTGHEKVSIRASSMGGVILMAYLGTYGSEKIDKMIFQCCPILGTEVAGELLSGNVTLNKDALIRYGEQALPQVESDPLSAFLYVLIEVLEAGGMWQKIINLGDDVIAAIGDRVIKEGLYPIFGTMPGIWSFVSDEYYAAARAAAVNDEAQPGVCAQIDNYHYNIQNKARDILTAAKADGKQIYIVCGYNMQRTPLVPEAMMNDSDGTVDTKYASVGATVAPLLEKLPDGYTQQVDDGHNHLSADGRIDASTCILPDSTWFLKDMLHCNVHEGIREMYRWMFGDNTQKTVFDNPDYPQFLQCDEKRASLTPITADPAPAEPGINPFVDIIPDFSGSMTFLEFAAVIVNYLKQLKALIISL